MAIPTIKDVIKQIQAFDSKTCGSAKAAEMSVAREFVLKKLEELDGLTRKEINELLNTLNQWRKNSNFHPHFKTLLYNAALAIAGAKPINPQDPFSLTDIDQIEKEGGQLIAISTGYVFDIHSLVGFYNSKQGYNVLNPFNRQPIDDKDWETVRSEAQRLNIKMPPASRVSPPADPAAIAARMASDAKLALELAQQEQKRGAGALDIFAVAEPLPAIARIPQTRRISAQMQHHQPRPASAASHQRPAQGTRPPRRASESEAAPDFIARIALSLSNVLSAIFRSMRGFIVGREVENTPARVLESGAVRDLIDSGRLSIQEAIGLSSDQRASLESEVVRSFIHSGRLSVQEAIGLNRDQRTSLESEVVRDLIDSGLLSVQQAIRLDLDQRASLESEVVRSLMANGHLRIKDAIQMGRGGRNNLESEAVRRLIDSGHLSVQQAIGLNQHQRASLERGHSPHSPRIFQGQRAPLGRSDLSAFPSLPSYS